MKKIAAVALCFAAMQAAHAADRVPVAVIWMGDGATLEAGERVVGDVYKAVARSQTARALDGVEMRRALTNGGPATQAAQLLARAELAFAKLKYADAAKDLEAAEKLLIEEVPLSVAQTRLGAVERMLLACYDQLARGVDAARAAERLMWTAGSHDDVAQLLERHLRAREWMPAFPPVTIESTPPGASVYRNLLPVGTTPVTIASGDARIDIVDVEAPGMRRAHQPLALATGTPTPPVAVALAPEERLGVLVDNLRALPEPTPEAAAAIGKRVGAARVLLVAPDGAKLWARAVDVKAQKWLAVAIRTDAQGPVAMERLAGYVSPAPPAVAAAAKPADAPPPKKKWGWGKWYTWVAGAAVVVLVGGLLIAQNVGDDSLKVSVSKAGLTLPAK